MQRLLHEIMHLSGRYAMSQLKEFDLSHGQMGILMNLEERGEMSQSDLAKEIHLKPPSITVAIRKLEKKDLIVRKPDENDQRIIRIDITEKGRACVTPVKEILKQVDTCLCKDMSAEEVMLLRRLLMQMRNNLEVEVLRTSNGNEEGGTIC